MKFFLCAVLLFFSVADSLVAKDGKPVKILLVGDSTTIGDTPRELDPEGLHLEGMIEVLAEAEGLPALEVINTGRGGETAASLLGSKKYAETIAPVSDVDYIFVRLGINDWYRCDDFQADFPGQMKALLAELRKDHPEAVIFAATICRFMAPEDCVEVNDLIKKIAKNEGLAVFDVYTPYQQFLIENGENSLNVRQPLLDSIPEVHHEWLKPWTHFRKGWGRKPDTYVLKLNDQSLDPVFGHIKGWYSDRHPNTAGYNLIARETVRFLAPILGKVSG